VDALEILDVARQHDQDVVVGARHQEAPYDRGAFDHLRLECFQRFLALALERNPNQHGRGEAELREIERGLVAADVAFVL